MIVMLNKRFSNARNNWKRNSTKASGNNLRQNPVNRAKLGLIGILRRPAFQTQRAARSFQPPQPGTAETTRFLQPPSVLWLAVTGINGQNRGNFWFHGRPRKEYFEEVQLPWNYGPALRRWPHDKSS